MQRNNLVRAKGVQSVRAPMFVTKLHLESIGCQHLDDGSNLPGDKFQLR